MHYATLVAGSTVNTWEIWFYQINGLVLNVSVKIPPGDAVRDKSNQDSQNLILGHPYAVVKALSNFRRNPGCESGLSIYCISGKPSLSLDYSG